MTEESLDFVLEKAKEKVLVWASNLCGFIHDKDDCLFLLEEEYLNQIREDRMARMLASEVFIYIIF